MKAIRMILLTTAMVLGATNAHATTTKVGNGDDGTDLERLTPITAGPLWEARLKARERLERVNVSGIPGLGMLIPELMRTELFLTSKDARATVEHSGSMEISEDRSLVYARTFPEPYAATRFFPAALSLTDDQLIALHVHEALHRALPADIRANEDIVMHLTLALTSPGASYDRAASVASLYTRPQERSVTSENSIATSVQAKVEVKLPEKSPSVFTYGMFAALDAGSDSRFVTHSFDLLTSLGGYMAIRSVAIEPRLRVNAQFSGSDFQRAFGSGPITLEMQGQVWLSEKANLTPFIRYTAQSTDDQIYVSGAGRDVYTAGAIYESVGRASYSSTSVFYSLPSASSPRYEGYDGYTPIETEYKSVISLTNHTGWRFGKLFVGGIGEVHAFGGATQRVSHPGSYEPEARPVAASRLVVLGPEVGFSSERMQLGLYGKWVVNDATKGLELLGDPANRGIGNALVGVSGSLIF